METKVIDAFNKNKTIIQDKSTDTIVQDYQKLSDKIDEVILKIKKKKKKS